MGQGMFPAKIYIGQIAVVFGIVLSGWGATQWTASRSAIRSGLGAPWFIVGLSGLLPWRLFEWWYVYDAYAPRVFATGGAIAAAGGVAGALVAAVNCALWRARQNRDW